MATVALELRANEPPPSRGASGAIHRWCAGGSPCCAAGVGRVHRAAAGGRLRAAFAKGLPVYLAAIREPDTLSAIRLSLLAAGVSVPLNLVFGVAAAWTIAKFQFKGKSFWSP